MYVKDEFAEDIKIYGEYKKTVLKPGSSAAVEKPVFDTSKTITYDGNTHTIEEFLRGGEIPTGAKIEVLDGDLKDAGTYVVKVSLEDEEIFCWDDEEESRDSYTVTIKIEKAQITPNKLNWTVGEDGVPSLSVRGNSEITFTYTYYDEDGNVLTPAEIADGLECAKVVAKLNNNNYAMVDAANKVVAEVKYLPKGEEPDEPNGGTPSGNPSGENPSGSMPGNSDGNNNGGSGTLDEIIEKLKDVPLWQLITSIISLILIIVFVSKGAGYLSKSKQDKKMAESKYKTYYAGAFLGLSLGGWTATACVLVVLAAASLIFMILAKSKYNKSQVYAEGLREEYERNKKEEEKQEARQRDENMRMMFMGMMGGSAGGNGGGYGIGADEIRVIISETVNALLPSVQQMLPQQAGMSEETMQKMLDQNDDKMEKLMKQNDERVEKLMDKIMELTANQGEVQVVEKVVEVPVEKIVEKVVEVPVEKVVEVEKIVEKEVAAAVEPKPKKEIAPKLTLDEAYALLTKEQKKYFDGIKEYALTKDKCKEKKSTYAVTLGQSTVNPLVKLTIKKDNVVALFKMEDEFMKDLRRDASGDGTKLKVKETELVVGDAQAFETAKKMVDLREDQIERYQDLLKEQRAMKK